MNDRRKAGQACYERHAMSVFLDACRRKPTPYTPVWLMRQAGRYQPEYRAIRAKVSFLELCKTPSLAAEVTVLAAEQLGADAGIIFADILLLLEPLRIGFEFTKDDGPKIHEPVRTAAQVDAVDGEADVAAALAYVLDAIRLVKRDLRVPLIGFAAAPFTLASYAIEGGGSKSYHATKKLMASDPALFRALMAKISGATLSYLRAQVAAGADAIQLFDSWVGVLSPADYRTHVKPHVTRILEGLGSDVPVIHFAAGNPALLADAASAGGHVLGVDWRVDVEEAFAITGDRMAVQGNLDPAYLLASEQAMRDAATRLLESVGPRPGHVFNLGHGIMPEANPAQVRALCDHVKEVSARLRAS